MHKARKLGAKIVTIDPHRSPTATRSDWWIPIRPGTDAALAMGIMHILFRDGLEDRDYLDRYCLGAAELRQRALAEYSPERVSAITGISAADIEDADSRICPIDARSRRSVFHPTPALRLARSYWRRRAQWRCGRYICCIPAVIGGAGGIRAAALC